MCQPIILQKREMWISFLCHCVFRYSSLRSRWLLRSECSTALMGWFGIQLDAGSYFGMPDKVFWWRTIAAASGDSLMVYGWEHTPCLWLHKTMHYVLFFPYHTVSHSTTHHTGQRHTTSASTALLLCYQHARLLSNKLYSCLFLRSKKHTLSKQEQVCFQKSFIIFFFLEMNRSGLFCHFDFLLFVCSSGNSVVSQRLCTEAS